MIAQNLRYAVRTLRRSPLLTGTALAALALGIGANVGLFSVINAVLLRPLSYPQPDRIVELQRHYPGQDVWATTPGKFAFWRDRSQVFEAVAAHSFLPLGMNLIGRGEPQVVMGMSTTADYFRVLGIQPALGRTYTSAEDQPGAGKYAVLSYPLWQQLFRADHRALGQTLSLGNESYQVIGVMPKGFQSPHPADLWVPLQLKIDPTDFSNDYPVIARLKRGVSLEQARADMRVVGARFRKLYGREAMGDHESISVVRYHDYLVGDAKGPLWILLGAVAFVLLIACANVANLLLARSTIRQREMSVRVAVGASRIQIINQLLTESLLLSLAGAAVGCLLAYLSLPLLLRLAPANTPGLSEASVDSKVLLYALGIAVVTGVLFGIFPALQSARLEVANPLREGSTRTTASLASQRVRQALVIAEVAITLVLLIGASLLVKTLRTLQSVQPGFDASNVLTMQMSLNKRYKTPTSLALLNSQVAARLSSVPGIVSVASSGFLPLFPYADLPFEIVGKPVKQDDMPDERYRLVSPKYFSTLRIPVVKGREFSENDSAQATQVLIVNEAFAAKYFPHEDPLGRQILIGRVMGPLFADKPRLIVGVVGSIRDVGLSRPAPPEMFEPEAQQPAALLTLFTSAIPLNWLVRTTRDPMSIAPLIRREALTVAGDVPLARPKPLSDIVQESLAQQRFVMILLTVFAGLALLLGTVGLYGVISYSVAQRTRELGIRSALGARRSDLLKLVVGEGMRLAIAGLALGLFVAFGLTRYLQSMLYGTSPSDPAVLTAVTLAMAAVALGASFIPAFRAAQVNPVVALHQE